METNHLALIRLGMRFTNLPVAPTFFAYFAKTVGHPATS